MTDETKAAPRTSRASVREEFDPIVAFNGAAAETFIKTCQVYTNGAATMNAEVMSFINTRLTRHVELSRAVSKCENWTSIVNVQQRWVRQVAEKYFTEANKLVQLAAKLTQEGWEPVYEQAKQTIVESNKPSP